MASSHHDREEETLIAYFQQMLAEVDDQEFDGEIQSQSGTLEPTPTKDSVYTEESNHQVLEKTNAAIHAYEGHGATDSGVAVKSEEKSDSSFDYATKYDDFAHNQDKDKEDDLTPQMQPQVAVEVESREFAQPSDSLKRLLASIDTNDTMSATQVNLVNKIATATATKTEVATKPKNEVKTEIKVETKVAEVKPEVKVAKPKVETVAKVQPKVETKVTPKVETKVEPKVEVKVATTPTVATTVTKTAQTTKKVVKTPQQIAQEKMAAKLHSISAEWKNVDLGEQFQVLFFLVQGVRFAVPLIDLGGIFECDKITQLFGKPSWFMGITDARGFKINVVDTLRWVMPEVGDSPDKYPYLISLGTSQWSIGCDVLEGNRTLTKSQIKWREIPGNRPWLAGIVTSDKCALLHVQALINLFDAGAGIEDLTRSLPKKEEPKKQNNPVKK